MDICVKMGCVLFLLVVYLIDNMIVNVECSVM